MCPTSPGSTLDSSPRNTASATMRHVHGPLDRHNRTLKNAAHHHGGCMMRKRYSRFTARLTVAGDTPKDLAPRRCLTPPATNLMTAASCSSDNRRESSQFLCRPPSPSPNPPWCSVEWTPVPGRTPRRRNRPEYTPRTAPANRASASRYWAQGCSLSARLRILTPRRCRSWMFPIDVQPAPPDAVDGHHNQGVALSQPGVQESASPAGRWYRRFRKRRHPDRC